MEASCRSSVIDSFDLYQGTTLVRAEGSTINIRAWPLHNQISQGYRPSHYCSVFGTSEDVP